jgi:hypothetical protein
VQFEVPVRYLRHQPETSGNTLRISVDPVNLGGEPERPDPREIRPGRTNHLRCLDRRCAHRRDLLRPDTSLSGRAGKRLPQPPRARSPHPGIATDPIRNRRHDRSRRGWHRRHPRCAPIDERATRDPRWGERSSHRIADTGP